MSGCADESFIFKGFVGLLDSRIQLGQISMRRVAVSARPMGETHVVSALAVSGTPAKQAS